MMTFVVPFIAHKCKVKGIVLRPYRLLKVTTELNWLLFNDLFNDDGPKRLFILPDSTWASYHFRVDHERVKL